LSANFLSAKIFSYKKKYFFQVDQNTEITETENQFIKGLVAFLIGICLHSWELAEDKTEKV